MHRLIIVLTLTITLALGAFVGVAGAGGPIPTCKFGQKNPQPCQWPTTTTTAPRDPHCIETPIVKNGVPMCLTRGRGGFPHYVPLP